MLYEVITILDDRSRVGLIFIPELDLSGDLTPVVPYLDRAKKTLVPLGTQVPVSYNFV